MGISDQTWRWKKEGQIKRKVSSEWICPKIRCWCYRIFLNVVKFSSLSVILGLRVALDLECQHLDAKTTFLHGELKEEIHMEKMEGFKVRGKEILVCNLKNSLHGLKWTPPQWYDELDTFMLECGFRGLGTNNYVYIRRYDQEKYIILFFMWISC